LRTEVDDAVEAVRSSDRIQRVLITEVDLFEAEGIAMGILYPRQSGALQRGIIIVVQIVDAYHFLVTLQKGKGGRRSDEPGYTGDEDGHGPVLAEQD
jgi:hypothetical protein